MFEKEKKLNELENLTEKEENEDNDYENENGNDNGYFFPDFRKFLR